MKILTDRQHVIIAISTICEEVGTNLKLDDFYIHNAGLTVYDVEDITSFEVQKKCYDGTNLYANPNYVAPIDESEVIALKDRITLMEQAMNDLLMAQTGGTV